MPKKKPTKKATKSATKKRARRAATTSRELVATVKSSALYKLLRNEGIKKKKANRIVRAATAPVRAAVGIVEALPSTPTTTAGSAASTPAPAAANAAPTKKAVKKTVRKAATKSAGASAPSSLENLTKADLLARARTANVAGRSAMGKDELIAALRRT